MKTLQQWWAERSPQQQSYISLRCREWFDPTQPDGLIHSDPVDYTINDLRTSSWSDQDYKRTLINMLLAKDKATGKYKVFPEEGNTVRQEILSKMVYSHNALAIAAKMDFEHAHKVVASSFNDHKNMEVFLFHLLIETKDFDHIDWEGLIQKHLFHANCDSVCEGFNDALITMVPTDVLIKFVKVDSSIIQCWHELPINSDLFDRVMFVDEDVPNNIRKTIVTKFAKACNYEGNEIMDRYLKQLVAVNRRYLKGLRDHCNTSRLNTMYCAKKDTPICNPFDTDAVKKAEAISKKHRYSQEVREFAMIAASCDRKRVFGKRVKGCGDSAGLLALYNYDFDQIFNSMYPVDPNNPCALDA